MGPQILRAALIFMANNAAGYILIAFIISYGLNVLKMPANQVLFVSTLAACGWFAFTLLGGYLAIDLAGCELFRLAIVCWRSGRFRCGS